MERIQITFGNLVTLSVLFIIIHCIVPYVNDLFTSLLSVVINFSLFRVSPGPSQDYPFSFSLGLSFQGH